MTVTRQQAEREYEFHRGQCRLVFGSKVRLEQEVYYADGVVEPFGPVIWVTQGLWSYIPIWEDADWHTAGDCDPEWVDEE